MRLDELPAFSFLDDLAGVGSAALSGELEGSFTFQSVQQSLQAALVQAFPGASVLLELAGGEVKYRISLGDTINTTLPLDADLGFPALGLSIDAGLDVAFSWGFDFTIGASLDGVFLEVGAAPELQIDVSATLAPGSIASGTLGFLQLSVSDDPNNPTAFAGSFSIDLTDPGVGAANNGRVTLDELASLGVANLGDLVDVQIAGSAAARLDLELSSVYNLSDIPLLGLPAVSLPKILADLDATWNLANPASPTVGFGNIRLDVGEFFAGFGSEALSAIESAIRPIKPILDVLTARLPVLSDIGAAASFLDLDRDGKVTLLDAAKALGGTVDTRMISGLSYLADLITSVNQINAATGSSGGFVIPLPSLDLSGQNLKVPGGLTNFQIPDHANFDLTAAINTINTQAVRNAANNFVQKTEQAPDGLDFSMPVLQNPSSVMGLLLGRDVDLFRFDLPRLELDFTISRFFPFIGPIGVEIAGTFRVRGDLAFGYDTLGLREFHESNYSNRELLADGFFIYDRVDGQGKPSAEGADLPELTMSGILAVNGKVEIVVGSASVGGDLTADVMFDLPDGGEDNPADGRTRISELGDCGISIDGRLSAGLNASISVGVWPLKKTWSKNIARVTLLDFSFGCDVPEELATLSGGVLTLNVGSDRDERFTISKVVDDQGVDQLRVSGYGNTQDFPLAQVTRIVGNFGAGNDSLHIDPEISVPAWIVGGTGADTITGGSGNDAILGGNGTITADAQGNPVFNGTAGDNSADELSGGAATT